ncbi:MAG: universal stress protein [Solirubrobacterales bacterium]
MIDRILVGYDGSEQAEDALAVAAGLAANLKAELRMGASLSEEQLLQPAETVDEALSHESEALLSAARQHLSELGDYEIDGRALLSDSPADGLLDLSETERADLLVIGSTHRGGVGRVLPGSLALQIIGSTGCPLVIAPRRVPHDGEAGTGPVVAAFDGGDLASRAVKFAAQLAAQADAPLHVVGVAVSQAQVEAALAGYGVQAGSAPDRATLQEELEQLLEELPDNVAANWTVVEGSPVDTLVNAAQGSRGIFVSGSHGRGPLMSLILGSVSDAVAQRISWPAVLVPPQVKVDGID